MQLSFSRISQSLFSLISRLTKTTCNAGASVDIARFSCITFASCTGSHARYRCITRTYDSSSTTMRPSRGATCTCGLKLLMIMPLSISALTGNVGGRVKERVFKIECNIYVRPEGCYCGITR